MGRTGHHEDCGCSKIFWNFTKYRHHNTNANKKRRRKLNLEEDLLARGTDVGRTRQHGDRG